MQRGKNGLNRIFLYDLLSETTTTQFIRVFLSNTITNFHI